MDRKKKECILKVNFYVKYFQKKNKIKEGDGVYVKSYGFCAYGIIVNIMKKAKVKKRK